ncbi:MAG: radical SAM family heme chaperone HemW [Pseudomonadales bacterium]|nr:radical SAM family heme chaperone HemW [Pseudomonadales bacterium]
MLPNPGLYVHLPWCIKKCPYCDFNSHPLKPESDLSAYIEAILEEWRHRHSGFDEQLSFKSVFFGGGTPSLFAPENFAQVLQEIPVAIGAEITMEANPGTTEHVDFGRYLTAGINRLSIGAQTFNNRHLVELGRIHAAEDAKSAFASARKSGFDNINIDLMWGLPGQTVDNALNDLAIAIDLGPEHISWYQLTLEPKTEFAARPPILPREPVLAEIEALGFELLEKAEYARYEVSAFTRKRPCQQNLNYWQFGDYIGLGAGAHGKETKQSTPQRTQNPHQPRVYTATPTMGNRSKIPTSELPFEFMLNALRLKDGVSFPTFKIQTGLEWDLVAANWERLVAKTLVRDDRIATTPLGYRYLDSVVAEFLID